MKRKHPGPLQKDSMYETQDYEDPTRQTGHDPAQIDLTFDTCAGQSGEPGKFLITSFLY